MNLATAKLSLEMLTESRNQCCQNVSLRDSLALSCCEIGRDRLWLLSIIWVMGEIMEVLRKVQVTGSKNSLFGLGARIGRIAALSLAMIGLAGCSWGGSILPKERETVESRFRSFDEAYAAFRTVRVQSTTVEELGAIGFNSRDVPYLEILTYLDLIERFMPRDSIRFADLDASVQDCLRAQLGCKGFIVKPSDIKSERIGSAFMDIFDFRRTQIRYGWEAEALFVMHEDVVVYKLWSGRPRINERREKVNPLGPFQNIGVALTKAL